MDAFNEMRGEQRRQIVDVEQVFASYRKALHQYGHSYEGAYTGSMRWVKVGGKEYLYRTYNKVRRSLGPRSVETEKLKADYTRHRTRLRMRIASLEKRLEEMAPINNAMRLGRLPRTAARVLRELDRVGLLGKKLFVVGTNSLYAYEARAGVFLEGSVLATEDADLLVDARRNLRLALIDVRKEGIIGLLQKVDRTFTKERSYSAANDEGYRIDLICPQDADYIRAPSPRIGESTADIEPAPIEGLKWLLDAPKYDATVVAEDGLPVYLPCIDPRVYALHKLWLSRRQDREPTKRVRDVHQATIVAALCRTHLGLDFAAKELSAMPESIYGLRKELAGAADKLLVAELD